MSPDKLAYMANQIGRFFVSQSAATAPAEIADHIIKFWDPRMRRDILAHIDQIALDPPVREAIETLRRA
jgi:formate dehydrogenase subunit delta